MLILYKIFISFTTIFMLLFFFFFKEILVPFTSLFWKPFFVFNNSYLAFLHVGKNLLKKNILLVFLYALKINLTIWKVFYFLFHQNFLHWNFLHQIYFKRIRGNVVSNIHWHLFFFNIVFTFFKKHSRNTYNYSLF